MSVDEVTQKIRLQGRDNNQSHSFATPALIMARNVDRGTTTQTLLPHSVQRKSSVVSFTIFPQFAQISTVFFKNAP